MLPIYKICIEHDEDDTEVNYNALVDYPAHMRAFESYGKQKVETFIDLEKRRVTGVMVAEGTPIYRRDSQLGEHLVVFLKDEIMKMWKDFCSKGYFNRVNEQHDSNRKIKEGKGGIYMLEAWIVDPDRNMGVPPALSKQGIRPGSIMATYQIEDDAIWQKVKNGEFNGFSIEGMFIKYLAHVKRVTIDNQEVTDRSLFRQILKMI